MHATELADTVPMRCPECGATAPGAPGDARFCAFCGAPLGGGAGVERRAAAAGNRGAPARSVGGGAQDTRSAWTAFLDAAWEFFASTRVATVIIFLIAVAAIAGSLVEQEGLYADWRPPEIYYPVRYGPLWGNLFLKLGLTRAYTSVWFVALVYLGVVSLVVCSLQRLVPLHRALQRPQASKPESFLRRLPVVAELPYGPGQLERLYDLLARQRFRMWTARGSLHADKGRLSRYGPYVIHIGLIIAAFAATSKVVPGWDVTQDLWVADGQTMAIPGTHLALRNEKFTLETYPSGMPREYRTDAVLLDSGREVVRAPIRVNHPMRYQGWEIYQASFRQEPGIASFRVVERSSGKVLDTLTIDLKNPAPEYTPRGSYRVLVREYYPDFTVDPTTQQPTNKSRDIVNPVFLLSFTGAGGAEVGRQALAVALTAGQEVPVFASGPIYLEQTGLEMRWYTGLRAHRDRTVPLMFGALSVVMLGMGITFFLFHRQLWAVEAGGSIVLGGWSYKNRLGLQREVERIASAMGGRVIKGYRGLGMTARGVQPPPDRTGDVPDGTVPDPVLQEGERRAVRVD